MIVIAIGLEQDYKAQSGQTRFVLNERGSARSFLSPDAELVEAPSSRGLGVSEPSPAGATLRGVNRKNDSDSNLIDLSINLIN